MSDPFLGEIRIFAGNFAPNGWAFCNGQIESIAQNTALFSLLGTTYGGNGHVDVCLAQSSKPFPDPLGTRSWPLELCAWTVERHRNSDAQHESNAGAYAPCRAFGKQRHGDTIGPDRCLPGTAERSRGSRRYCNQRLYHRSDWNRSSLHYGCCRRKSAIWHSSALPCSLVHHRVARYLSVKKLTVRQTIRRSRSLQ